MPPPSPRQDQALLFLCHRTESGFIKRFKALEKAFEPHGHAFFVFDTSASSLPAKIESLRYFTFSKSSLNALRYPWLQDSLMPGHVHYPILDFALKNPQYSHYWVVEYDVRFTGPWSIFFRWARRSDADLLCTHLSRYEEQPSWWWWPSFSHPDKRIEPRACARFFGPIYRLSREAVLFLDSQLKSGWQGHQEVVIPTLLSHAGLRLQDLARDSSFACQSGWSWYTRSKPDPRGELAGSTMRFRPPMAHVGFRPLTLYHPIKSADYGYQAFTTIVRRKFPFLFGKRAVLTDDGNLP